MISYVTCCDILEHICIIPKGHNPDFACKGREKVGIGYPCLAGISVGPRFQIVASEAMDKH